MNRFQIIHSYQRLVKEGRANALKCPDCDLAYVPCFNPQNDDEPALECYACGAVITLGLNSWQQIEAVVKEHVIY